MDEPESAAIHASSSDQGPDGVTPVMTTDGTMRLSTIRAGMDQGEGAQDEDVACRDCEGRYDVDDAPEMSRWRLPLRTQWVPRASRGAGNSSIRRNGRWCAPCVPATRYLSEHRFSFGRRMHQAAAR